MNIQYIQEIKKLNATAKTLSSLCDKFFNVIKDTSCDKHSLKFGGDDRFSVFSTKVFLDCHTGYYGNSSCSTFASVENTLAQRLLNAALNKNMRLILADMADFAKKEAAELTGKAKKELEELSKLIEDSEVKND